MFIPSVIHRRRVLLLTVLVLLLSLSGGIVGTQAAQQEAHPAQTVQQEVPPEPAATTAENDFVSCTATNDIITTCELKAVANQSSLDLTTDILPIAKQVNPAITADTVMWMQAWGGQGGEGNCNLVGNVCVDPGSPGGLGGFAQTITSINAYQARHGTLNLYYYFGDCCLNLATFWGNGGGAASSIVASVATDFSLSNTLLVAGGGGGANAYENLTSGQIGGYGGAAIATAGHSTYGAGQSLAGNGGTAQGGSTNGPGDGGAGVNSGCNGDAGIGGQGGGYEASGKVGGISKWANGDPSVGTAGAGASDCDTPGTPAGGGFGGGGVNGCGKVQHHNCAGPGGGSFAGGLTHYDGYAPAGSGGNKTDSRIHLVFNIAPGSFSFATPIANPFGIVPEDQGFSTPTFVDIDGDGDQDFFYGDENGGTWGYPNSGTASNPSFGAGQGGPFGIIGTGGNSAPTFVDIDGDGDFDLFNGDKFGGIWYQENTGTSTIADFGAGQANPFGIVPRDEGYSTPELVDIDGDGDFDLFYGDEAGGIWYHENTGSRTSPAFGAGQGNPFGIMGTGGNSVPAFVDIDGDGDFDLFNGDKFGGIWFQVNMGTANSPAFGPGVGNPGGLRTPAKGNTAPTMVDLTDDGYADLFVGDQGGGFWYYQNNGSPSAAEPLGEPALPFDAAPEMGVELRPLSGGQLVTVVSVYGSEAFDASQVNRDIVALEDWSGNRLATLLQHFWGSATGDVNGDGLLNRTLIFYSDHAERAALEFEVSDGKELCLRGVTLDGVKYDACAFVEG